MDPSAATRRQNALCSRALAAEEGGQLAQAITLYRQAVAVDRRNPVPCLYLGHALERAGEEEAACAVYSLAADLDARIVNAWRGRVRADVAMRSRAANDAIRRWFTRQHRDAVAAWQAAHPDSDVSRIAAAIWCQTHAESFTFREARQRPHVFYVPDLAPLALIGHEHAPWLRMLEAGYAVVRAEYEAALEHARHLETPYLTRDSAPGGAAWQPLVGNTNWGSLHLYRRSQPNAALLAHFPQTLALLESLPLLRVAGAPREVLFSVLRAHQRIPPHYGLANTDATVHLPLVVPGPAALRVATHTVHWREGSAVAFDDSFEHESWNDADEPRVTLLFEAWHPDLREDERAAVAAAFEVRERWNASRERHLLAPGGEAAPTSTL